MNQRNTHSKGRPVSGKWTAGIIILAVILLSGAAYVILNQPKSPCEFYYQAEARNFKRYADSVKSSWNRFSEQQRPYLDDIYRSRTEISADIVPEKESGSIFSMGISKGIVDIVGKCKLIVDTGNDYANKESQTKASLLIESTPILDINAVTKADKAYLSVPVIFPDRFFMVDLDDVGEVYKKFSLDLRLSGLVIKPDIADAILFDAGQFDAAAAAYGDLLKSYIGPDNVSYGEDLEYESDMNGIRTDAREIFVTLDGQKAQTLLRDLFAAASADELLSAVVHDNISSIISLYGKAGYIETIKVLAEDGYIKLDPGLTDMLAYLDSAWKTGLTGDIQKLLKDTGEGITVSDGVSMKVIADRQGNILERDVTIPFGDVNGARLNITVGARMNSLEGDVFKNSCHRIGIESITADGVKSSYVFELDSDFGGKAAETGEKGNVMLTLSASGKTTGILKCALDIETISDKLALTDDTTITYKITIGDGTDPEAGIDQEMGTGAEIGIGAEMGTIEGNVTVSRWRNDKKRTSNSVSVLTSRIAMPSSLFAADSPEAGGTDTGGIEVVNLQLKFSNETKFGYDLQLPVIEDSKITDLNALDAEGVSDLQKEALASFGILYLENSDLFGSLFGGE